ncbi:hypothetical protein BJ170DRAFT_596654 [Xylariales sp. AK1849]|nr:hypothetical protein BJ170DRAFT_596654 [Xylariales sp. AK1849]
MRSSLFIPLLAATAHLATSHFSIKYPEWRANTLSEDENTTYSQWDYPCGGVPNGVGTRTDWPITGGSVSLALHHPWTYVYINLGLGTNASNFNISLTSPFVNVTGNGTYCIPVLLMPATVYEGQNASIQVVTSGATGSALYNCADITFRGAAQPLSGNDCKNTTVSAVYVGQSTAETSSTNSTDSASGTNTAPGMGVNFGALTGVVGLALAFAAGLSL